LCIKLARFYLKHEKRTIKSGSYNFLKCMDAYVRQALTPILLCPELSLRRDKMIEEELIKRVVVDPKIMLGKPVIKGTRLTVEIIVEKMAYGATLDDLMKDYPFLTEEDIRSALLYAAKRLAHEEVYAA